jgi:hypothetical protein
MHHRQNGELGASLAFNLSCLRHEKFESGFALNMDNGFPSIQQPKGKILISITRPFAAGNITMPYLDLSQASLQEPYAAISGPTEPSYLLNLPGIAVDELSLYGQCTNPVYCDEANIKRGDNCPKCGYKRE